MGASSPEVSFHAFSALKPVVSVVDDDNATRSRNDLITVGALGGLSRQTRSPAPEVAVTANDVLANLLPFVTDVKRIKLSAAETNNLLSAAAHIGAMYAEQSQPVAAVAAYRIAIALDPNHPQLVTALAVELAKTGAVDEALQLLSKAVALDQHNTIEANFHRLKIAAQRNDAKTDDYIKSLRRALMSAADETHPLLGAAYLLMIQALETAGRLDTAIECAYEWTLRSPGGSASVLHLRTTSARGQSDGQRRRRTHIRRCARSQQVRGQVSSRHRESQAEGRRKGEALHRRSIPLRRYVVGVYDCRFYTTSARGSP